jgi:hypothetical protein
MQKLKWNSLSTDDYDTPKRILNSAQNVEKWVEDQDYMGYEPFDGLSSFLRHFALGNLSLERILLQAVRRVPFNIRPLIGIKPLDSTIGRGYMAWGYLIMMDCIEHRKYGDKARSCLRWLIDNKSPGYEDFSWGKHFDFASRGGRYPRFEPITVWTSLIGFAFLKAYEVFKEDEYLGIADSICRWISTLSKNETKTGICFSYTGSGDNNCTIHNHNMLAAALLSRVSKLVGTPEYRDLAELAMRYSCSRQLPNGGWYYGEDPARRWIDNFHTGYNLDSIKYYIESTNDKTYESNLRRGLEFYMCNFFDKSGRPRYYYNRTYPIDIQCISQSIDTLSNYADIEASALVLALKVATWAIENMQDEKGFFYYRQYHFVKSKTPMLHWAQATMYKALASLISKMKLLKKH